MSLKASSYTVKKPTHQKTNSLSKPRSPGTPSPTKLPTTNSTASLKEKTRSLSGQFQGRQQPPSKSNPSDNSSVQEESPIVKNLFGPSFLAKEEKSVELNFTNLLGEDLILGGSSSNLFSRELELLKKEVTRKNVLIENLMGENSELRHQMDAFLASVDRTQADIDGHLSECNQKIIDLELEVQKLREENKKIKDQYLSRSPKVGGANKSIGEENILSRSDEFGAGANIAMAMNNKTIEDFLFNLTEKATEFMEYSKKKYEQFDRKVHLVTASRTQGTSPTGKSESRKGLELEKRPSGQGRLETEIAKKYQAVPSKVFYLAQGNYKPKTRLSQDTASTAAKKMARTLKTEEFSLEKRRSYNFD